jgi:AhpD family alkylhydroperoxidase
MGVDHVEQHRHLRQGLGRLGDALPPVISGFVKLHGAAMADGALPASTKELVALAISITSHCEGCVAFHVHDALRAGATRAEIEEILGVAIAMGGGPAAVYAVTALDALEQFEGA